MMRIEGWAAQVSAWKQSGQPIRQWCTENGMGRKTFYYRRKRVAEEMLEAAEAQGALRKPTLIGNSQSADSIGSGHGTALWGRAANDPGKPAFVALPMPPARGAAVTFRLGEFSVDIQNGADETLVGHVLRTVAQL
jgi:hypothetical protein